MKSPAPWSMQARRYVNRHFYILDRDGRPIAKMVASRKTSEMRADAMLMAAAPALHSALKAARSALWADAEMEASEGRSGKASEAIAAIDDALSKAEGTAE